jgi:hypothetical protein
MNQIVGTLVGLLVTFILTFVFLMLGSFMPADVISPTIVNEFLSYPDLEIKLAIVGTILYPPHLGQILSYGATQSTVLMAVTWGTGGLIAGLISRDFVQGVFAALFSVILGAFLTWIIIFLVASGNFALLFSPLSLSIMENSLLGAIYPAIASVIGGVLGGGISRERR